MEWLNFRHLYAFWMVSRVGGFKKAAERMRVAQSAVSDQVSQLEEYLDQKLLDRSTRHVRLTAAGTRLLAYAHIIFEQSYEINSVIRDRAYSSDVMNLRLGIVGGVSRNFIFKLLSGFFETNEGAHVSVTTGSYAELNDQLKKYELDLILTLELPKKRDLEELRYQKLGHSTLCLAGSRSMISAIKRRRRKSPINIYQFRHPYEVDLIKSVVEPKVRTEAVLRLDTDDIPLLRFFATSTDGLVLIPTIGIFDEIEAGTLDYLPLENCSEVNIYGIFMKKMVHQEGIKQLLSRR